MNYKVLYRKYRPCDFDSLVGQKHTVNILKNSIAQNKICHAYIFSGPRGTGKTSTARIFAKAINCLDNKTGVACGKCENCLSFDTNPDIIEIDAASNNGVDEIRELINNIKLMPTSLKYKVYIIDEVHMLSTSAFNALLLTLEEPPEHVIFIMATTNVENVPITILSRCQRFDFTKINDKDILERLEFVCKNENINYEVDGLKEIATLSDGGLRDALSILDQLSKSNEIISANFVNSELGSVSDKKIKELIKEVDNNNIIKIEEYFKEFEDINLNYKVFIKKIINILSDTAIVLLNDDDGWRLTFDDCKNIIFELNDIINKINISVNPYLLIKMCLLKYVKINKKNIDKVEVIPDKNEVINNKNEIKEVDNISVLNSLIDIRINNTFVEATKTELLKLKSIWNEIKLNCDSSLKGLISDTDIVMASHKYVLFVSLIPHLEMELNKNIEVIEDLLNNKTNEKQKIVFVSKERWNLEKDKYLKNIKNGLKYKYIEETETKDIDNSVDGIFNNVEVE